MIGVAALLWAVQIANAAHDYSFDRFGLRPRAASGLWGVFTQPFLHRSYAHLLSDTVPLVAIGWTLLLAGIRVFLFVTALVVVIGGLLAWLLAPSGQLIVGASPLIFGWLGYLLARAFFARRLRWIITAALLLLFFGSLLGGLLPTVTGHFSWQANLCGFVTGIAVGWLLHPRGAARSGRRNRTP